MVRKEEEYPFGRSTGTLAARRQQMDAEKGKAFVEILNDELVTDE